MKKQNGFTLLELLVALTIGIFILAGLSSLFIKSNHSYRVSENMSRMQENSRFAMAFLGKDIRETDYRGCATEDLLDNAISGTNDGGLNGSDSVTILTQPNDCGGDTVTTIYTVKNGTGGNPALFRSIDGTDQELIEGVQNIQLLYGEDIDSNNSPNYYVDSATVTDMTKVISVRLTLTLQTLDDNIATNGGRVTRDFTSTIALRNRLP